MILKLLSITIEVLFLLTLKNFRHLRVLLNCSLSANNQPAIKIIFIR